MNGMKKMNLLKIKELVMLQFPVFGQDCNISHFITTRCGGVGTAAYQGLNTGYFCGDNPDTVRTNRRLLCQSMGIEPDRLFVPYQSHEDNIVKLTEASLFLDKDARRDLLYGVDALVTDVPGICLGVTTADCVPVLLYDPVKKVVAAIHAGWRGTVKQIVLKTIRFMEKEYGCNSEAVLAGIGPCIGMEAFEVGEEVADSFIGAGLPVEEFSRRNVQTGKLHLDLSKANRLQLLQAGVSPSQINEAGLCTFSDKILFFSARRLGFNSGRMLSGIQLTNTLQE